MFYKKEENGYFYFKSDKDNFFFWPFENIYFKWEFLKENIDLWLDLKSYKNLVWIWNKKVFVFLYTNKGLVIEKNLNKKL